MFPCAYKNILGIDCPICGFQRSFQLAINGDILESIRLYPPLFPIILLAILIILHLFDKQLIKQKHLHLFSFFVLFVIASNYLLKNIV